MNSKDVPEVKGPEVRGGKRDESITVNRRGLIQIAPERLATSQSGDGLCSGEAVEFLVSEIELVEGRLLGVITNRSKEPWRPWIDVEVFVKGRPRGKFQIEDPVVHAPLPNVLETGEHTAFDQLVQARFLEALGQLKDPGAGVRICYRKVKTATKSPS